MQIVTLEFLLNKCRLLGPSMQGEIRHKNLNTRNGPMTHPDSENSDETAHAYRPIRYFTDLTESVNILEWSITRPMISLRECVC